MRGREGKEKGGGEGDRCAPPDLQLLGPPVPCNSHIVLILARCRTVHLLFRGNTFHAFICNTAWPAFIASPIAA